MNRFNAASPHLDGDELNAAAAQEAEARYIRGREAHGIEPATGLRLLSEESSAALALEKLDVRIRAMLTILLGDGHITPMGVRQLTRILDQ